MKIYELKMGQERLSLNSDMFTWKIIRNLIVELEKHRKTYVALVNGPLEDLEKLNEEFGDRLKKTDDESDDAYKERVKPVSKELELKAKKLNIKWEAIDRTLFALAFPILGELAKIGGQTPKVTMENVENASWIETKTFLYQVLKACDLGVAEIFNPNKE